MVLSGVALGVPEQPHKRDVDTQIANDLGDVGHYAGTVLLDANDRAVLPAEIHLYAVDVDNPYFSTPKGLSTNKHNQVGSVF